MERGLTVEEGKKSSWHLPVLAMTADVIQATHKEWSEVWNGWVMYQSLLKQSSSVQGSILLFQSSFKY